MSKSRGNVVDPNAMVDEFGADALRYFLLREVPFGQDGDFSRDAFIGRINSDLANGLGNLLSRTLTMIERFAGGRIPGDVPTQATEVDNLLQHHASQLPLLLEIHLRDLAFNRALEAIWNVVQTADQYIDKTAPWILAKKPEDKARLDSVLYHAAEALRFLTLVIYPFMPHTALEMKRQLGLMVNFEKPILGDQIAWGGLIPGTEISKGGALFPRVETTTAQGGPRVTQDQPIAPQPVPSAQPSVTPGGTPAPAVSQIGLEDFQKIQLRTAKILTAERVPKSEKLIKLQVDLGGEQRQVVAGIGKKYEPETLVGKTVVIVANLKPAKLMGVESQGMVLAAGDAEVLELITLQSDISPGIKVK